MTRSPYEMLGQEDIRALAEAFYQVMDELPQAAEVRAMHAANLTDIKRLLAAYLTGWLGGPPVYLAMKGTVCLTEVHARYAIGPQERDQWLMCMDEALERIGASDKLKVMLKEPMFRIADAVRNRDEPDARPRAPNLIAVG